MGDVQNTKQQPKFWVRLVTGFAGASLLPTVFFLLYCYFQEVSARWQYNNVRPELMRISVVVVVVAIFVVAWPVETWFIKPHFSRRRILGVYSLALAIVTVALEIWTYFREVNTDYWKFYGPMSFMLFAVLGLFAIASACLGCLIYPWLLRNPITTGILVVLPLALCLV